MDGGGGGGASDDGGRAANVSTILSVYHRERLQRITSSMTCSAAQRGLLGIGGVSSSPDPAENPASTRPSSTNIAAGAICLRNANPQVIVHMWTKDDSQPLKYDRIAAKDPGKCQD